MKLLVTIVLICITLFCVTPARAFNPYWWIGGWILALNAYDRYIRETPTTRQDVIRLWQERPRREP